MKFVLLTILVVIFIPFSFLKNVTSEHLSYNHNKIPKSIKLPACQACKVLVDSFQTELQRAFEIFSTFNSQQQEEETLDEKIFKETLTNMCREDRGQDQCITLVEKCKSNLRDWWFRDKGETPDIMQYLCIGQLQFCCPNGHFGPECKPCPGYPDSVCNDNGKCKGNGTRKGNGQCSCDVGYTGSMCNECAPSYYTSYKDDNKMLCARCHSACEGNCSRPGPTGCQGCREGWKLHKTKGCVDINECFAKRPPCKRNEFCINNEGSYSCLACDQSCDTCSGDGPDMCEKCAPGYTLKDNMCVNDKYVSYSDLTRYLTYLGLCFATYIVFQNSPWAASAIGICVAIYVTVSEYLLGTLSPINFLSFSTTSGGVDNLWHNEM